MASFAPLLKRCIDLHQERRDNPRALEDAIRYLRAASAALGRLERTDPDVIGSLHEVHWLLDSAVLGALEAAAIPFD